MYIDPSGYAAITIGIGVFWILVGVGVIGFGTLAIIEMETQAISRGFNELGNRLRELERVMQRSSGISDTSHTDDFPNIMFSDRSGKVTPPSWVHPGMVRPDQSPSQNADRLMTEKFGPNFQRGPGDHSTIRKWIEWMRGVRGRGGRGGPTSFA